MKELHNFNTQSEVNQFFNSRIIKLERMLEMLLEDAPEHIKHYIETGEKIEPIKPTIKELENILNDVKEHTIIAQPNGSVTTISMPENSKIEETETKKE